MVEDQGASRYGCSFLEKLAYTFVVDRIPIPTEYSLLQLKVLSPIIVLANDNQTYMMLCASSRKIKAVRCPRGHIPKN